MKRQEHWKLNPDGSLAGVYGLDLSKVKGDRWQRIEETIQNWARLHPLEMAQHLQDVVAVSEEQNNKYASTKSGLRFGCSVPAGLGTQLTLVEPDLFSSKHLLNQFMRKFPGFKVAQCV